MRLPVDFGRLGWPRTVGWPSCDAGQAERDAPGGRDGRLFRLGCMDCDAATLTAPSKTGVDSARGEGYFPFSFKFIGDSAAIPGNTMFSELRRSGVIGLLTA